jgi:hypothetical protein
VILVTGPGRCGTAWASKTLRLAGLDITHQGIRHDHVLGDLLPGDAGADGDSSFEAAPVSARLRSEGWRVVLLHRDPESVARSWVRLGVFTDDMRNTHTWWYASLLQHCPHVLDQDTSLARAAAYVDAWTALVDPDVTVECGDHFALAAACGVESPGDIGPVDRGTPTSVTARLAGHYPALPDVAGFADRFQRSFVLELLPTGNVAESLIAQEVWEAQESTVAVDILASTPGVVLDIGAQVGWYTILAGLFGDHPIIAFEPDARAAAALAVNVARHGVDVEHRSTWVGPDTPPITLDGDVALMKCDIEGADCHAVNACADLFRAHRIQYALIEVSPIFSGSGCDYVTMVGRLRDWGYRVYRVPPKGWEHNDAYREAPLATLKEHRELGDDWAKVVAGCRQDNFVFIRSEDA